MNARPVVLDVDPGVDDSLAILLAVASPEFDLRGVSVVWGNVPVEQGTRNALDVLAFANASHVPVYCGADRPLLRAPVHTTEVHGETGLGQATLPTSRETARDDAVGFLAEQVGAGATLIALGPLTNVALAEQAHPGLLRQAPEVVVMGGAVLAPGNSSPTAEYNFYADPDAAKTVVDSGANLTLVPLDVTHKVRMTDGEVAACVAPREASVGGDDRKARFFREASEVVIQRGRETGGFAGIHLHDPVAVAWAIDSGIFTADTFRIDVESEGRLTAGQVVVDRRRVEEDLKAGRSVRCVIGADLEQFLMLFRVRALGL